MFAQQATLRGTVTNESNERLPGVSIAVLGQAIGTNTSNNGRYTLKVPAGQRLQVIYVLLGMKTDTVQIAPLRANTTKVQNVQLQASTITTEGVVVEGDRVNDDPFLERIDSRPFEFIPTPSGNLDISSIGIGITGSADELSSQYSVRGGSYDENLVYVNDFQIYRPFLIRSGQQEGLTFPNVDLIRSIAFSAGGFQARYGDALSSVLDIKYKQPDSLRASVGFSFLGGAAHIEGVVRPKNGKRPRFRYLAGARYKTTRYLLGSLETEGEYIPNFLDLQYYLTYDLSKTWQLAWIANYNRSAYDFRPQSRNTTLGLVNFAFQYNVVFDGQEVDDFTTYMTGVSLSHVPENSNHYIKFLASTYQSNENERIDILGRYLLGVLETDIGSDDAGEILAVVGVGSQQNFVRNYLTANVTNAAIKGGWQVTNGASNHHLRYGVRYQNEIINDQLNEWERLDSAGYSLPYSDNLVNIFNRLRSTTSLQSNRYQAYVQHTWKVTPDSTGEFGITAGVRASWWDLNRETTITPRVQFYYKPLRLRNSLLLKASFGMYYQPPFYREMRNLEGVVNTDLLSQKSIHAVLGFAYDFKIGERPFKFITEAYYKSLNDLVAYDVDNVRIRYYGNNNMRGYATGIDFRLNGEFVTNAESWINLSFLRTRERFLDVEHQVRFVGDSTGTVVRDVPRPTDQLLSLSMFFQDYLPSSEHFKMNLNLTVGTGWPFGIPQNNITYRNTYRYSPYHRVDIGFAYQLWDAGRAQRGQTKNPFRVFNRAWISLEVFNLLQVANAASNTWVKTIKNQQLAVPNYLTSRRVNLRMKVHF